MNSPNKQNITPLATGARPVPTTEPRAVDQAQEALAKEIERELSRPVNILERLEVDNADRVEAAKKLRTRLSVEMDMKMTDETNALRVRTDQRTNQVDTINAVGRQDFEETKRRIEEIRSRYSEDLRALDMIISAGQAHESAVAKLRRPVIDSSTK